MILGIVLVDAAVLIAVLLASGEDPVSRVSYISGATSTLRAGIPPLWNPGIPPRGNPGRLLYVVTRNNPSSSKQQDIQPSILCALRR